VPLEDRLTPAASVSFQAGNLTVTADNVSNSVFVHVGNAGEVRVWVAGGVNAASAYHSDPAAALAQYQTPAHFHGAYAVTGTVLVTTGNSADFVVVAIDAPGGGLPGSLRVVTGNGDDDVVVRSAGGSPGRVAGSIDAALGNGADRLALQNLSVGGSVMANGLLSGIRVVGSGLFPGDALVLSGTTVHGSVHTTGLVTLLDDGLGANRVHGHLIVNAQTLAHPWVFQTSDAKPYPANSAINSAYAGLLVVQADSLVEGNVVFAGGPGNDGLYLYGNVLGHVTATLGAGDNDAFLGDDRYAAAPRIGGSLTVFGGGGADRIALVDGTALDGNVALNLGDGANRYDLDRDFRVGGAFGLTAGTGPDDVGLVSGRIAGDQTYSLGGGANALAWAGVAGGARFTYNGGGGVDRLSVHGVNAFRLVVNLGAGDDVFAYGAGAAVGQALIDFGPGADAYDATATIVRWDTTLLNL
jgi:hypothetical protein